MKEFLKYYETVLHIFPVCRGDSHAVKQSEQPPL